MSREQRILRVFNNNVVLLGSASEDSGMTPELHKGLELGNERVAIGKGLAFGKKRGDLIDPEKIEKTFVLSKGEVNPQLEAILSSIDPEVFIATEEIVSLLGDSATQEAKRSLLLALTDHISLALQRERKGIACTNPLLAEIKQFYVKEFEIAQEAGCIIKQNCGVQVCEEELGFIALHIANATMVGRPDNLVRSLQIIQKTLSLIQRRLNMHFNEDDLQYQRFLRHLQFFALRLLSDERSSQSTQYTDDEFLFEMTRKSNPQLLEVIEELDLIIGRDFHTRITNSEKGYLAYHLKNLIQQKEKGSSCKE